MAMTRIEDGIQDTEPIRFLELLGLDEEDLAGYSIRLNGSNPEWGKWSDLPDAYYFSYDDLMKWIFTKKWPDKDKATAQIHTRKVLQFIQLKPENPHPTQWLFVGAYDVLDEYTENDGKILYRYNEIPEYASLKARAVVYYKRDPGYTGVVFNLSNNEERRRDFLKTMTLEKIAQSPVSALPFSGYENVRLTHRQLVAAVNNEEWRAALGSVQAVYLQTDRRTGWHYVGSAYSRKGASHGLLSRWKEYASGDHSGGNKQLRNLGAGYIEKNFPTDTIPSPNERTPTNTNDPVGSSYRLRLAVPAVTSPRVGSGTLAEIGDRVLRIVMFEVLPTPRPVFIARGASKGFLSKFRHIRNDYGLSI